MEIKSVKIEDYKAWCAEQMTLPGHPVGCDHLPSRATKDYVIDMHGLYLCGGHHVVNDGFQEKWQWLVDNCTIGPKGLMIVPRILPRFSDDDEHDLWWKLHCRLHPKYLGTDGIIYFVPTLSKNHIDEVEMMIYSYIELLERELESLGFVYDEESDYGYGPGQIDPNLHYVNMHGERRRLSDAPSYGC